jgi:signal transduction histidine kinase
VSKDRKELPQPKVSGAGFERRKEFVRLTAADHALLSDLREVFERHSDEVVDRFYEHLQSFDEVQPLLSDDGTVSRLKAFQQGYLVSLTGGEYGPEYVQERLAIGRVHSRIGLEPEWYLGTYGLYLDLLLPLIQEQHAGDTQQAIRASSALAKLMILDMQLVLDAYYGIRQKQALERSEQLAAVGELAASIAHEVRNPLAGMKGALQVLGKELDSAHQEIVDELLAQIERLEGLVRDLLTFARPSNVSRETFDVHELLDRVLRLYSEQCDSQRVTVERVYEPGTGRLSADPRQLEQVFLNLIHNALQAMPEGGSLTVRSRLVNAKLELSFADTGRGIPAADLPRVHLPFFTTKHRGSGLGLSIVKKIVEAHGGSLELTSEEGKGARIAVQFPIEGEG